MSAALRQGMTVDEFLTWERGQELRYEFDGMRTVAMTGGSLNHSAIATNLATALGQRLRSPCRVYRGDVKILAAASVRYPDAVVTCSPVDGRSDMVPDPVVVFEVLSPSTASTDRTVKNAEYRATPSIQHYVMLEQVRVGATLFSRDGANWNAQILLGDAVLALPALGLEIPLAEIYAGVEVPNTDD